MVLAGCSCEGMVWREDGVSNDEAENAKKSAAD